MKVHGITHSVCAQCSSIVPARIETDDRAVFFRKFCPSHGESTTRIHGAPGDYLAAHRYVKPALRPDCFHGDSKAACPDGCGFCERHEQHLCMPIIEITSRCDLSCPACINSSGENSGGEMSLNEFRQVLDRVLAAERQIDVLNISGGEPLRHPELFPIIDEALSREGIIRVSISTNGLRFLEEPRLLAELHARKVVISLQFDGFTEVPYTLFRGRPLVEEKRSILKMLKDMGTTTSLTMTVAGGINDDQIRTLLDLLFSEPHIVSVMLQPLAFTGRGISLSGKAEKLSIPDVLQRIEDAGHPSVRKGDFVPLPCSHPLCFSLAFYLALEEGRAVSVNRLADAGTVIDSLSNRVVFGLDSKEHERLKSMIYDLWSGPAGAVPESKAVLQTLRDILRELSKDPCCSFDPRKTFAVAERRVKSIFIHAFQDADTFDLARVRRCCQGYPQSDGRLLPACVRNVIRIGMAERC